MSTKISPVYLVFQNHQAGSPDELTVAANDLIHAYRVDEDNPDWIWVRKLGRNNRVGRIPRDRIECIHENDGTADALGDLFLANAEVGNEIKHIILASSYSTVTGYDGRLRDRLQQGEAAIAGLLESWQTVVNHFQHLVPELALRAQDVVDPVDDLEQEPGETHIDNDQDTDIQDDFCTLPSVVHRHSKILNTPSEAEEETDCQCAECYSQKARIDVEDPHNCQPYNVLDDHDLHDKDTTVNGHDASTDHQDCRSRNCAACDPMFPGKLEHELLHSPRILSRSVRGSGRDYSTDHDDSDDLDDSGFWEQHNGEAPAVANAQPTARNESPVAGDHVFTEDMPGSATCAKSQKLCGTTRKRRYDDVDEGTSEHQGDEKKVRKFAYLRGSTSRANVISEPQASQEITWIIGCCRFVGGLEQDTPEGKAIEIESDECRW
jgi:hypothetical protein